MAIYQGSVFPEWHGDLLIASLAERSLRRVELDGINIRSQELVELDLDERLRDVRVSPDGHIYLLTDSPDGRVLRLMPSE